MKNILFKKVKISIVTFLMTFIILTIIVFSLIGLVTINIRDDMANSAENELTEDSSLITNSIAQVGVDVLLFKNILESYALNNQDYLNNNTKRNEIASLGLDWFNTKKKYNELKVVDENGNVKIQIKQDYENKKSVIVGEVNLNIETKKTFLEAKNLEENEIMISGFTLAEGLNEVNVVDGSYIPTFTIITPFFSKNNNSNSNLKGYIIYNIYTDSITENIKNSNVEIINKNGYYFFSNNPSYAVDGFFNDGLVKKSWSEHNAFNPLIMEEAKGSKLGYDDSVSYYKITSSQIETSVRSLTQSNVKIKDSNIILVLTLKKHFSENKFYSLLRIWQYLSPLLIFIVSYIIAKTVDEISYNRDKVVLGFEEIANTDELTKLPNRKKAFYDLGLMTKELKKFGVFFIDLDGFKDINDIYGHDAGDKILIEFARRFNACISDSGVVYRIGGDEFLIIINTSDKEKLIDIANKLINECNKTVLIEDVNKIVGLSIGISIFDENKKSIDTLIDEADNAMYDIKKDCKNNYKFYED